MALNGFRGPYGAWTPTHAAGVYGERGMTSRLFNCLACGTDWQPAAGLPDYWPDTCSVTDREAGSPVNPVVSDRIRKDLLVFGRKILPMRPRCIQRDPVVAPAGPDLRARLALFNRRNLPGDWNARLERCNRRRGNSYAEIKERPKYEPNS